MNVEYIVGFVKNKWGIDVPYEEEEIHWAANVEYLLKVVDYVNGKLNNGEKTNYGESEYATKEVVDTIAANQAIRTLIKKKKIEGGEFWYITDEGRAMLVVEGACGTFTVDWGDGTTETSDEENGDYCGFAFYHRYEDDAEQHKITLRGNATKYRERRMDIYFGEDARALTEIGGCLGCIFHTQADGSQPAFYHTFYRARITEIPVGFFDGIYGAGREEMFLTTFENCENLKSIPAGLFSNITAGAPHMFRETFLGSGITEIPENLFSNITSGGQDMFVYTFAETGITEIPDNLFASLETGAEYMFRGTFGGCENLATIGDDVFASIESGAEYMFEGTFDGCKNLTTIGDGMFRGLKTATDNTFANTFKHCNNLTSIGDEMFASLTTASNDMLVNFFSSMPNLTTIGARMFAGITTGEPYMFQGVFSNKPKLTTIGDGMFASLETGAEGMFEATFNECPNLTTIGDGMFASLTTGAENMFVLTFNSCKNLTAIGDGMFASLKTGAERMFAATFNHTGITEIPDNMFASLETGAEEMFNSTFTSCEKLTKVGNILPKLAGPADYPDYMFQYMFLEDWRLENTLRIGPAGKELWEMWPDVSEWQGTYRAAPQIPDYSAIPDVWR